jgi:uncharacterized SAM-binding protein YcdF (DUF218 family)
MAASRFLGVIGLALLLITIFTPLPTQLSRWLSRMGPAEPAAAIVVLGGGGVRPDGQLSNTSLRRALHGISLHRQGFAPLLVFSGSVSHGYAEAQVQAALARECGVRPGSVLTESRARTTREEAVTLRERLQPLGIRRILLVTDAEGMRRAIGVFERNGFDPVPASVADVSAGARSPESRLGVMRRVVMESLAWLYYRLAGYI